jgi:hypothetical protein
MCASTSLAFDVADAALKATFQCWADEGSGAYFNASELDSAVTAALRAPFRVLDVSMDVPDLSMCTVHRKSGSQITGLTTNSPDAACNPDIPQPSRALSITVYATTEEPLGLIHQNTLTWLHEECKQGKNTHRVTNILTLCRIEKPLQSLRQ